MTNHRFISILVTVFLLFSVILGGTGCGGGHSSFLNNEKVDEPNEPTPNNVFTVTFDSNGGSEVTSIEVTSGSTIEAPIDPTKEDYIFAGWYKDNNTFNELFIFGTDGEKITQDITLYAQWADPYTLIAEYALREIVIGYAAGDNPKYVTKNLTLPTKIGSADISWISNSGAVSSNGTITRQNTDTDVILTATASYNGKTSEPKTFNLKVIKKRTRDNSKIAPLTLEKARSGDIMVERNASGDIKDIEGQYVSFDIENADDALDAVTVLRNELRIKNPAQELEIAIVTSDNSGAEYQFQQVYNGIKVFGRTIMASANAKGKGDFLHSKLLPSEVIVKADGKSDIGQSTAENNAKASHSGSITVETANTEKIIYSLSNYEADPIYAYIVNVYGLNGDGEYIDENVFVNAVTGTVIYNFSNIHEASQHGIAMTKFVSSNNELGQHMQFPITLSEGEWRMIDTQDTPRIEIYSRDISSGIWWWKTYNYVSRKPGDENKQDWDNQAVSAYTNFREIMKWWKISFDRNSLDNKGMIVKVITHFKKAYNAAWNGDKEVFYVYNVPNSIFPKEDLELFFLKDYYSFAPAIDMLTHESTHAIIKYDVPGGLPYKDITGAINEAYADIFGCLKDKNDWKLGELMHTKNSQVKCLRDVSNPSAKYALSTIAESSPYNVSEHFPYTTDANFPGDEEGDHGGVHDNSYIVSRTAYLMHEDYAGNGIGLTWDELGKVWYKSLHMGLSSLSNFEDVRRCVVWSAQKISLSDTKIAAIKEAFDEVGITTVIKGSLRGSVTDYDNENLFLSGVKVTVFDTAASSGFVLPYIIEEKTTPISGRYKLDLEAGRYNVLVAKNGYLSLSAFPTIYESEDVKMDVKLVKPGVGSVNGIILNSSSKLPIEGVTLNIRSGWFIQDDTIEATTSTDVNGQYTFDLGENGAGYYTIEMIKDGYTTSTFNVTVSGQTKWKDEYLERKDVTTPDPVVTDIPIDEAHFPDAGFRTYINDKIDNNKDSILNKTEIQDTTKIDVGFWNYTIHSLQGIEYFTNLKELHCNSQSLTSLDLSKNTALQVLGCNGNQLTMLNVSGCNMLKEIHCDGDLNSNTYGNRLTKLDVSSCTALEYLSCRGNKLTELDVSKNIALKNLLCDVNQLTFLDVRKNTALQGLVCDHNQLAELDVSKNNDLQRLDCSYNKLVILDISKNVKLQKLTCWNNQLTVLDVSGCSSLEQIYCSHNQLIELDLAENTALQELSCRDNQLIELKNISDCTALRTLDCWNNQLTKLDLTKNVVLSKLECRYNQLTVLDVSHCYQYINVYCDNNVIVTYPPSRTTSLSTANSNALEDTSIIVANLPTFIAGTTGEYSFNVSLDKIVSAESTLIFKNASEHLFGVFLDENGEEITMPTTTSLDRVKVSALFDAGVTYSPVIIAQSDESLNNSGGCNGEACGIFTLSLLCLIAKKVQHKHNKKRR